MFALLFRFHSGLRRRRITFDWKHLQKHWSALQVLLERPSGPNDNYYYINKVNNGSAIWRNSLRMNGASARKNAIIISLVHQFNSISLQLIARSFAHTGGRARSRCVIRIAFDALRKVISTGQRMAHFSLSLSAFAVLSNLLTQLLSWRIYRFHILACFSARFPCARRALKDIRSKFGARFDLIFGLSWARLGLALPFGLFRAGLACCCDFY